MARASIIASEVDLEAEGKAVGCLRLLHSSHRSAYGWIPIPVASIRRGDGPTVLVMAGNHGDEYEGQILVAGLVREVEARMVTGQLILLPMANFPAAEAGMRTSPLDGGNLNRSFPGDPAGSPTQAIAHFVETELVSRADVLIDLHSGGSSLLYHGANAMTLEPCDEAEHARMRALMAAFGLPTAFLIAGHPSGATSTAAARRQGAFVITTELGGAGMVAPAILRQADQGLRHLLGHLGVLSGPLVPDRAPATPRLMRVDAATHYVYARDAGLFEPLAELGDVVAAGQPAARLHFPETPMRAPETVRFEGSGVVVCKRVPAQARRGDCLFHLAADCG
ncbi:MAG: succinylglutamate desuccinylase/aspartoacylase family protein [Alphaproteobacteria bacterium]|nr:succinylglutamate desuccinylase/aspartoacylase family protein [Alphaproteobacteria bacterium]